MTLFRRFACTLLLAVALATPALADVPAPSPAPGGQLPQIQLPGTPAGMDPGTLLDALRKNLPQVFGSLGRDGSGLPGSAADAIANVLERIRAQNPTSGMDSSPLGRISPEVLQQGLDFLRGLGSSIADGSVARGQFDPSLIGALGKLLPPETVGALQQLQLQPDQIRQVQELVTEFGPKIISSRPEDLPALQASVRDRLQRVLTPQQLETLRSAETRLRKKP